MPRQRRLQEEGKARIEDRENKRLELQEKQDASPRRQRALQKAKERAEKKAQKLKELEEKRNRRNR